MRARFDTIVEPLYSDGIMTLDVITVIVAAVALGIQQWRGQHKTELAIGELRAEMGSRISKLEGLFEGFNKYREQQP